MGYYSLIIPHESAWVVLNELGKQKALHFVDLNQNESVFNRPYAVYIRRCDELERRLRFLEAELNKFEIPITSADDTQQFLEFMDAYLAERERPASVYIEDLENELENIEKDIVDQSGSYDSTDTNYNKLKELELVLSETKNFYLGKQAISSIGSEMSSMFTTLNGVINISNIERFKRMVFRASRGNAVTEIFETDTKMKDIKTEKMEQKAVFMILFKQGQSGALTTRLNKICDSFGASVFEVPQTEEEIMRLRSQTEERLMQQDNIRTTTKDRIIELLSFYSKPQTPGGPSWISVLKWFVLKEKSIYHTLNLLKMRSNVFHGECWCPTNLEDFLREKLTKLTTTHPDLPPSQLKNYEGLNGEQFPRGEIHPTYFNTNAFTGTFQEIVDTYGIPNYKEANPGLFTCFTFPFLFGMMFGDVGHGLLLFTFASVLCLAHGKVKALDGIGSARYMLLLMGLCSTYNGLIYNDLMSVPLSLFGSSGWEQLTGNDQLTQEHRYIFGIDPKWYQASNNLVFLNSFKMKIAVVFGVIQMTVGLLFKGSNAIHFRSPVDFFFEFIPQLIFLCSIFGYMIVMVFIKWSTDWGYNWTNKAPNLISTLMNLALKLGALGEQEPLWGDGESQEQLQSLLLLIGVICVPIMLLVKPLILNCKYGGKKSKKAGSSSSSRSGSDEEGEEGETKALYQKMEDPGSEVDAEEEEFQFSEIFIHQTIETIEFVLNAISNTASYLRLWALSLAHAQLAEVFFEKCVLSAVETNNPAFVVIGFFIFINVTIAVLMMMDSLECFLHALRLHWVEFMGKFYHGDGRRFEPFDFAAVLKSGKI